MRNFLIFLKVISVFLISSLLLAYLSPFIHPKTIFFIPFFGLIYPILLTLNILILIVWIVLKSKWAFPVMATVLIGFPLHFRLYAFGSNSSEIENKKALTIMSYNVRLFDVYNPSMNQAIKSRDKIFDFLIKEDVDVMCFQEFYHQDKPTWFKTKDSLIEVLNIVDYHFRGAHSKRHRKNFGISILSQYPMIGKGQVAFDSQSKNDCNYCIYADILFNNDTVRIYNVHLQSIKIGYEMGEEYYENKSRNSFESLFQTVFNKLIDAYPKRADQAIRVVNHISKSPYPVVVCGDFNDTPLSYSYNQFNHNLIDAFRNCSKGIGSTYLGKIPAGRIDYIFHSEDLLSSNFKIQKEKLSDHKAIICDIFQKK